VGPATLQCDGAFDRLASVAARTLRTPAAMIVLVAEDKQFFKSTLGLPAELSAAREAPLAVGPAALTVAQAAPTVVSDAASDPRPAVRALREVFAMRAYLGVPLRTSDGQAVGCFAVLDRVGRAWTDEDAALLHDLGCSVITEVQLCESEQRYRAMVDLSPEPIAVHEAGRLVYINDAGIRLVGAKGPEQILGRNIMDFVHPDYRAAVRERARTTQEGNTAQKLEEKFLSLDGQAIDVEVVAMPITYQGHHATQVVIRDVTERRNAELTMRFLDDASAALATSLDYQQTLDRITALAVPALADVCLLEVPDESGAMQRVSVRADEPSKRGLVESLAARFPPLPDSDHPSLRAMRNAQPVLLSGLVEPENVPNIQGPEHAALIRALGFRTALFVPLVAHGRALGVITLVSTRAERRYDAGEVRLAEELAGRAALAVDNARAFKLAQEAIRIREDFLSVASHELRTPLTALQLNLERLGRAAAGGAGPSRERSEPLLAAALRQTEQLARLIDSLLDVARIVAGRMRLSPEALDLAELTRGVVARLEPSAVRAGCDITLDAPTPEPGRWDRLRIEQVLTNLLSNAIKYGAGKPIDVAVVGDGARVRLRVRDRGIGIAGQDLERIFARFERAVSSRAYGGLGLGLFISRDIVEAHGGSIRVESTPDHGATFEVVLPREP
jgi:PAS domain S-box-containing protein